MPYTLSQLLWALQQGRVSATKESVAAVILSATEQMQLAPLQVTADAISLTPAGAVVLAPAEQGDPLTCDARLRRLLSLLLRHAAGEHLPLTRVAEAPARGVPALAEELAAALIPFNRSAARRALVRLYQRLESAGAAPPAPEVSLFDAEPAQPRAVVVSQAPASLEREAASVGSDATWAAGASPCRDEASPYVTPQAPAADERTPFLGTMDLLSGSRARRPAPAARVEQAPPPVLASQRTRPSNDPAPDAGIPQGAAPAASAPAAARAAQLIFGRFTARRSRVGELVSEFAMETYPEAHLAAMALCRSVEREGTSGADASCTPPPPHSSTIIADV